ncbi:MAG: hypothetical protein B7Y02_12905, partial [Rhodobacterales bacterium 17-64-5]
MRGATFGAAFAALFLVPEMNLAEDLATIGDLDLLAKTREAVGTQNADAALMLLTEMQRRGVGLFAGQGPTVCKDAVELPTGITDWKFHAVARQAYIRTAMSRQIEAKSCGCMFEGFSFDDFVKGAMGKPAAALTDADRPALEAIRDQDRRDIEGRYRE